MSWTLVASNRNVDAVTLDSTGANFLFVAFVGFLSSVTGWDNKGNTWVKLSEHIVGSYRLTLAYCIAPTSVGPGHTITDPNAAGQDADIHFYAWTAPGQVVYQGETGADDNSFGGNSTKSAGYAGSMSVTPGDNDNLVMAAVGTYPGTSATTSAYGIDSGFTLAQSRPGTNPDYCGASGYLNQATAATVDPTISWTTSGGGVTRWVSAIAVFTVNILTRLNGVAATGQVGALAASAVNPVYPNLSSAYGSALGPTTAQIGVTINHTP